MSLTDAFILGLVLGAVTMAVGRQAFRGWLRRLIRKIRQRTRRPDDKDTQEAPGAKVIRLHRDDSLDFFDDDSDSEAGA